MNRQAKTEEVGALKALLDGAQVAVVAEYAGLTVENMVTLRTELRNAQGRFRVVKNTLAKIAVNDTPLEGLQDQLVGPVGLVYSQEDAPATAKAIVAFAKKNPKFIIRGGMLSDGTVLTEAGVKQLSELPGKDELRAMFLSTLMGVPRKLVGTFAAVPGGFVRVLAARERSLSGEG